MALTVQDCFDFARSLYLDVDTVDQAVSDTILFSFLNDYYFRWMAEYSTETIGETVLVFTAATKVKTLTPTNNDILKFVRVEAAGEILRKEPLDDLRNRQLYQATTAAAPSEWAVERVGITAGAAGFPIVHNIYIYPIPTGSVNVTVYTVSEPDPLTTVGDYMRVTSPEARFIARMVAAECSDLVGRENSFTQRILSPIPESIQVKMGLVRNFQKPRAERPGKESA